LRLDVRRIRSGASRNRLGDVVWLDFMAPHRHIVVDVTVTNACTNTNVPRVGARLPLPYNLALGAQMANFMRTSALLLCLARLRYSRIHDDYPFALEDEGRMAPKAAELVDRLATLVVVRRFLGIGAVDSRSLRPDNYYVPLHHFCGRWGFFSDRDTPTYNDRPHRVSNPRPSAY
jgi:hypothetical protein